VSEIKFFGVWLNHNSNWDCHMENLMVKLGKLCFANKTIRSFLNKNTVKTMYFAYLLSSLKYGILFWENSRKLTKIFHWQEWAIRLIANVSSTSCKPYFNKLKIMTLPRLYSYQILLYTKMYLPRFTNNSTAHSYDTRIKIYLLQSITPNYLKTVPLTMACLFIINLLMKLKVLHV